MTKFCRFCGSALPERENPLTNCPKCGQALNQPTQSLMIPSPPNQSSAPNGNSRGPVTDHDGGTASMDMGSLLQAAAQVSRGPVTDHDGGTASMDMGSLLQAAAEVSRGPVTDHDGGTASMDMGSLLKAAAAETSSRGPVTDRDGGTASMDMGSLLQAAAESSPRGPVTDRDGGTASMDMGSLLRAASESLKPVVSTPENAFDYFDFGPSSTSQPAPTAVPPAAPPSPGQPVSAPSVPTPQAGGLICSNCQRALPPNAKFCDSCGTPVVKKPTCPNCGTEVTSSARFCQNCGTPLAKAAPPAPPPPKPARLEVQPSGKLIDLPRKDGPILIGRTDVERGLIADVDLGPFEAKRLGVSRSHSQIYRKGDQWMIEDLNAPNFTQVNGKRILPGDAVAIKHGDELRFGELAVRLLVD